MKNMSREEEYKKGYDILVREFGDLKPSGIISKLKTIPTIYSYDREVKEAIDNPSEISIAYENDFSLKNIIITGKVIIEINLMGVSVKTKENGKSFIFRFCNGY